MITISRQRLKNSPQEVSTKAQKEKETKKDKNKRREMLRKTKKEVMNEKEDANLPGKKYDTPDERDPFRIFLETLYQQLPNDELPASWMMEYGLLPFDEAKKLYVNKQLESPVRDISRKKISTLSGDKLGKHASKRLPKSKKRYRIEGSLDEVSSLNLRKTKKIKKREPST